MIGKMDGHKCFCRVTVGPVFLIYLDLKLISSLKNIIYSLFFILLRIFGQNECS